MTNMQESTKKSRLLNLLKGIGVAVGILVAITVVIGVWSFAPGSTARLEEIARQFKAEPEWTLEERQINPARNVCLDTQCDKLYIRWALDKSLSTESLLKILANSNWSSFNSSRDCIPYDKNSGAGSRQCEAEGNINGYTVRVLVVTSYTKPYNSDVILRVERSI